MIFLLGMIYIFIVYKDWRYDTFLNRLPPEEEAFVYYTNYMESPVNENAVLLAYGLILWLRAFQHLKLISLTGGLFAVMEKLVKEMLIFAIFYFS